MLGYAAFVVLCWWLIVALLGPSPREGVRMQPRPVASAMPFEAMWQALGVLAPPSRPSEHGWLRHQPATGRWLDPQAQVAWQDAQHALLAGRFQGTAHAASEGLTDRVVWHAVPVLGAASSGTQALLTVGAPFLDDVQMWLQRADGDAMHLQLGDRFIDAHRPLQGRLHVAPFELRAQEPMILWVRVRSSGVMQVSLHLSSPPAHLAREANLSAFLGMVIGFAALAAAIYALVGAWLRDALILSYARFLLTLGLLFTGTWGLLLQAFTALPWWLNDLFSGLGALGPAYASAWMWILVLEMRTHFPWLYRLYAGSAIGILPLLALCVTDHYRILLHYAYLMAPVYGVLNLYMGWTLWKRSPGTLRLIYLSAFAVFVVGVQIAVFTATGLLAPHDWLAMAYPACTLLHTLIMAIAMAMRITALRQEKLLAEQRAEEHRRFVAVLAHEFRNPLSAIDRSANLLQTWTQATHAQVATRMQGIRAQVQRLTLLVDSFLLTAPGAGTRPGAALRPVRHDMRAFLQHMRDACGPDRAQRIRVRMPGGDFQAVFDSHTIQLALSNVLDNALRYSPPDALVRLCARRCDDGGCEIEVQDSGPGLSEEDRQGLGRPYYRGAASAGTQGTGLGYFFSAQLLDMQGGTLSALHAHPHGLRVILRLRAPES